MTLSRILRGEHPDRTQGWFNDGLKTGSVRNNQRTGDTKGKCWCRCANMSLCSGAELCFFHASVRWQRGTWTGNTYEGLSNLPKKMELENIRANFRSAFAKFQYAGSLHCSILSSCWCSYLGFSVIQASFWIFVAFRGHRDKVSHPWSPIDPRHKIQGQLTSTPAELVKVYSFALGVNPQLWSMLPLLLVALYFNITGIKHRKKYRLMVNFWKTRYILDTIWHFNVCKCAKPARLLCPWNSSGKNTGVGYCALFHGIFLTQGSNLHLLHLLH